MRVMTVVLLLMACGGTPPQQDEAAAEDRFWSAFLAADIDSAGKAQADMIAALPDGGDPVAERFIGMSFMLQVAEASHESTAPNAPVAMQQGLEHVSRAYAEGGPGDAVDLGHQSDFQYVIAGFMHNASLADQGRAGLQHAAEALPVFGNIARAPLFSAQALTSPDFPIGLESWFAAYEACLGKPVDRDQPDLSGLLTLTHPPEQECGNNPHATHVLEGGLLEFADTLVKAQKPEEARPIYELITQTPDFAAWPFASLVHDRLGSDLHARAALFADSDPSNDPPLGAGNCLQCHQK